MTNYLSYIDAKKQLCSKNIKIEDLKYFFNRYKNISSTNNIISNVYTEAHLRENSEILNWISENVPELKIVRSDVVKFFKKALADKKYAYAIEIFEENNLRCCDIEHIDKFVIELAEQDNHDCVECMYSKIGTCCFKKIPNDIVFLEACKNGNVQLAKFINSVSYISLRHRKDLYFKTACDYDRVELAEWLCSLRKDYVLEIENGTIVDWRIKHPLEKHVENGNLKKINSILGVEYEEFYPECPVCLENREGLYVKTKCGHVFCFDCNLGFKSSKKCAYCRTKLKITSFCLKSNAIGSTLSTN